MSTPRPWRAGDDDHPKPRRPTTGMGRMLLDAILDDLDEQGGNPADIAAAAERFRFRICAIEDEAAALSTPPPNLDGIADDVRYADGNGTSDYWRGFNDGIDRLRAALEGAPDE